MVFNATKNVIKLYIAQFAFGCTDPIWVRPTGILIPASPPEMVLAFLPTGTNPIARGLV